MLGSEKFETAQDERNWFGNSRMDETTGRHEPTQNERHAARHVGRDIPPFLFFSRWSKLQAVRSRALYNMTIALKNCMLKAEVVETLL